MENGEIRWKPDQEFRASALRGGIELPEFMEGGEAVSDGLGPYVHFSRPGFWVSTSDKPDLHALWQSAMPEP